MAIQVADDSAASDFGRIPGAIARGVGGIAKKVGQWGMESYDGAAPAQAPRPGVQAPAAKPTRPGVQDTAGLTPAHFGVQGDASKFRVDGSQLVSARSPQAIQADIQAHPPVTAAAGQALMKPAAPPAEMPSVGVQGAAPAPAAMPGVQMDPARAALHSGLRQAQADAERYGQGQWVFPPGTGTEPVWQANTAHERIAAYTNALANHNQTDPAAQIGLLRGIGNDPVARSTYFTGKGIPAAEQAAMPQPGAQVDPASGLDINGWLAAHKGDDLQTKLATVPHDTTNPIIRQALQRHIDSEYSNPQAWQDQASQLPGLEDYQYDGPSWLSGAAKAFSYGMDRTPFGGQILNENPVVFGLMKRHGLRPPGVNMPSSQQGIGNPN